MLYRVLLFLHVLGAILWFGGGVVFQLFTESAAASYDRTRLALLSDESNRLGKAYFGPVTVVVLITGLWLVFEGNWGFDHLFVVGGLVGFLASALVGGVFIGPTSKRLATALSDPATPDPELRAALTRLRNIGRVDAVIMLTVVFLMTVKPGP